MSFEEYPLVALAETTKDYVKQVRIEDAQPSSSDCKPQEKTIKNYEEKSQNPLLRRLPSFQTKLRPNIGKIRHSLQKINCFKGADEDEEEQAPMMDIPRRKSIDIGVGLARRMSLFIFTRKTVCVHPYHPYTPAQTTRKIYWSTEEKN
ncbi:uncharacterized protein LOC113518938 isoform X1 [Galleria mellonella]|uniref:Uncharacterized protein LOC113518938 isoform X1 n=1 Tax=Galleria mellonella TaxID=7137 RepID=A0ABM3MB96_GALME|nr:uncharacterized protein LOC113518938 isoform X1 [Galleria mellonella]